ncbi:MAG: hypothetical protein JXA77_00030 [Bacteroidales bacterium]|nr:hypothetical protein [Bacteroidales bacterium]MBN2821273.1 hypothetical protein [Bacteroidales bacterium]
MITLKKAVLRVLPLFVVLAVSGLTVQAGGILRMKPVTNSSKAVVSISNIDSKHLSISIEDINENVVFYQESLKDVTEFAKVFDFSQLRNGSYTMIVKAGNESLSESFNIVNGQLTVQESKKLQEPIFNLTEDNLVIFFNNKKAKDVTVEFLEGSKEFFTDYVDAKVTARKYALSNLPDGEFVVKVSTSDGFYAYELKK